VSISGKLDESVDRARELKCSRAFQIFTGSPRRWDSTPLELTEVEAFRKKIQESQFEVFVHMPYLPNLSSPNGEFYSKSKKVLTREIQRSASLGIRYLILHFGSHMKTTVEAGRTRIADACRSSIEETPDSDVRLLLENSADPKSVGSNFESMSEVLAQISNDKRTGVCLDTCHAFASGYDLSSAVGVEKTLDAFDSEMGLHKLYLIHLNDSKGKLGSGLDRHESIGKGSIGKKGMAAILTSKGILDVPVILETPKDHEGEDRENIEMTKKLAGC